MKCTCSKNDLKDALQAVVRAVAVKPTTPVLAGIYLRAAGNELELQATNFSIGVVAKVPANIEAEGATVVTGKYFSDIINRLSGEIVTLTNENDTSALTLKSDAASFEILSMDAEDFPRISPESATHSFRINRNTLKSLISRTVFACAKDDSRPVFAGCLIDISGTSVTFVATNASRIAIARDTILDELDRLQFILHAATLKNLIAMLASASDNTISVAFSGNSVAFTFDNIFLTSRLIDGTFPPYDKIIPAACSTTATLSPADLRVALDRMLIIAQETEYKSVLFRFTQDGLELSANSYAIGKSIEHIDSNVSGADLDLSFNISFLTDALKVFDSDALAFGMNQPLSPVKISAAGDDSFTYIITPLRHQ